MSTAKLISRLAQRRFTWILGSVATICLLHTLAIHYLEGRVSQALQDLQGPKNLAQFAPAPIKEPLQNAAPYYQAAWGLCAKGKSSHFEITDDWSAQIAANPSNARQLLERHRPVLELVSQAGQRTECNFGLHYERGWDMESSSLVEMRRLAFLLAVRVRLAQIEGDEEQMNYWTLQSCLFLSRIETDHNLIGLLIRHSCAKFLVSALEGASPSREAQHQLLLLERQLDEGWTRALAGEALLGNRIFEKAITKKEPIPLDDFHSQAPLTHVYSLVGAPALLADELDFLRQIRASQIAPERSPNPTWPVSRLLTPNLPKAYARISETRQALRKLAGR